MRQSRPHIWMITTAIGRRVELFQSLGSNGWWAEGSPTFGELEVGLGAGLV